MGKAKIEHARRHRMIEQAQRAMCDADGRPAIAVMSTQRRRPDRGVEAAAIPAAGQDTDSLGHDTPPRLV